MLDTRFSREVERIYAEGLSSTELDNIFTSNELSNIKGDTAFNLYPSNKKGSCCYYALFIVMEGYIRNNNKKYLSFAQGLDALISHMKNCTNITFKVDFITDVWKPDSWNKRSYELNKLIRNKEVNIRFHLYANGRFTILNI